MYSMSYQATKTLPQIIHILTRGRGKKVLCKPQLSYSKLLRLGRLTQKGFMKERNIEEVIKGVKWHQMHRKWKTIPSVQTEVMLHNN